MRYFLIVLILFCLLGCSQKFEVILKNDSSYPVWLKVGEKFEVAIPHSQNSIGKFKPGSYEWLLEESDGADIASGTIDLNKNKTLLVWLEGSNYEYEWY